GGSILHFDGSRYRVGPDSAGAGPGPACYRRGGPLTVTDANVMLGRIQPDHFPHVFGADGTEPLDADGVRKRFAELAAEIRAATGDDRTPEEVAEGFRQIAVANMANAVKKISVQKGHDVTRYALTTFGGAGGQHACAVADALGIRTVLVPPMAGVLSALGIGLADLTAIRQRSVEVAVTGEGVARAAEVAEELAEKAIAELGKHQGDVDVTRRAHLRYDGTDTTVAVQLGSADGMTAEFERLHKAQFSFLMDRPLIIEAVSVEATARSAEAPLPTVPRTGPAAPLGTVRLYADGWHDRSEEHTSELQST